MSYPKECEHEQGKGMCYHCAPWMFPDGPYEARRAYAVWHIEQGIPLRSSWARANQRLLQKLIQIAS